MADKEIDVKIKATAEGVQQTADSVKSLAEGVQGMVDQFKGIAEAVGAAFVVDKIDEFARSMSELGEQIERTSKMTGLSTDDVQKFQFAVKMTGGDSENAAMSLLRLERNMADAAAGSQKAKDSFAAAGVSMKTLASGDVNAILGEIADKFSTTADGANKTALAMQLAGRGGASLIPILDQGRAGLEHFASAQEATNSKLTEAQVQGFAKTAEQIKLMDAATLGVSEQIMTHLNPGIDAAVAGLTTMNEELSENIKEGGAWSQVIDVMGNAIEDLVVGLRIVGATFAGLWDIAGGAIRAIGQEWIGFGKTMLDVTSGDFTKAMADFSTAQDKAFGQFHDGVEKAKQEFQSLSDDVLKMQLAGVAGKISNTNEKKAKDQKPQIQLPDQSGKDDSAKDDYATQRSLLAEHYDQQKEMDDLAVQSGVMTNKERTADLERNLDLQQDLTDESFQQEMDAYEGDEAGYKKLIDQKSIADQKFAIEHEKLTQQQTAEDEKQWTSAINTFDKTFSTMLTGVLQGTQTISQAFTRMAQNMALSFATAAAEILAKNALLVISQEAGFTQIAAALTKNLGEWVLTENKKTEASITGDATRTASTTAAAAEGKAAEDAASSSEIMQDAAKAASGAYSALAGIPVIGPVIAPIAAGVAFAAVAAYDSFEVGTPYVPKTGLAMIHEGERITTADENRKGNNRGSGGGDTHLHVHALDHKDVKRYLSQNSHMVAKAVGGSIRNGNRSFAR